MKHRNAMRSAEYFNLPSIAAQCHGLTSLTFKPYIPNKWPETTVFPFQFPPPDHLAEQFFQHMTGGRVPTSSSSKDDSRNDGTLPKDPRLWSREDVANWVQRVVTAHSLPTVQLDRFHMNGKALCLMNMDMFVKRVPLGGKLLYKDFQLRLSSALYS